MNMYKLPKKLRLLNSPQFNFVIQQPQKICLRDILLLSRNNFLEYPRLGITIAKKIISLAHNRNRIKRLIRETFRIHKKSLANSDFIIVVTTTRFGVMDNKLIKTHLEKLWYEYWLNQ